MKILALESSGLRGSVAVLSGQSSAQAQVLGYARHEAYNEHAERMLSLVDQALSMSGLNKAEIDRIAVGVGPGSFTGVRVALALTQGLMLGLGVPGVGVGSLRAMAAAVPADDRRLRVVVRDARRDEYFVGVYTEVGAELVAPHAIPQTGVAEFLQSEYGSLKPETGFVVVGSRLSNLACFESAEFMDPDARSVGRLAFDLEPEQYPVEPCYVRGPNIVRPNLPSSPLDEARR